MTRRKQITMNLGQQIALASAGPDGHLTTRDRRVLGGLVRRGWVRVVETRKRRKLVRSYVITDAGRDAIAIGEVVQPRPRPLWRPHWDRTRLSEGCYVVEGHKLFRPARTMLWRILCPAYPTGHPVGYHSTLAEAVDALTTHLARSTCPRDVDTVPYDPEELDVPADDTTTRWPLRKAGLVDLDALDNQDGQLGTEPLQLGLFGGELPHLTTDIATSTKRRPCAP